jgi:hypothetical protein
MYSAINGRCFTGLLSDTYISDKSLIKKPKEDTGKVKPNQYVIVPDCKHGGKRGCYDCDLNKCNR